MYRPTPLSFIVPGFSKCGSTTLCSLLASHPEIFIPGIKETNYLIRPDYDQTWEKFDDMFSAATPDQIFGDGSIVYSTKNHEIEARNRIKKHYPGIKLIFIARDPINRIESSFREFHNSGPNYGLDTPYELMEAFQQLPAMINDTMFWSRLSAYRDVFSDDAIHLVFLEELKSNPELVMQGCFEFLGIDATVQLQTPDTQDNPGSRKLRDTHLLRGIRHTPYLGHLLSKVPVRVQDKIGRKIGLRRPFRKDDIHWDKATKNWLLDQLGNEMDSYLNYANRDKNLWSRFQKLSTESDSTEA